MDRNTVSHFSEVPHIEVQRSVFDRSSEHKTTFNAGKLIPIYIDEVLPGDTFTFDQAMVLRMSTPLYPVMDNSFLDVYYFFVPMRLVWEKSKQFFGENDSAPWDDMDELTIPSLRIFDEAVKTGSVADYFGIPVGVKPSSSGDDDLINALPFRAYALIWNEWFRDQNMMYPCDILADNNGTLDYTNDEFNPGLGSSLSVPACGGMPLPVAKFHDYFTSALPEPQKGDPISFNLGQGSFPVEFQLDDTARSDFLPFFTGTPGSSTLNLKGLSSGSIIALGLKGNDSADSYSLQLPEATSSTGASINQYLGISSFSKGGTVASLKGDQPVNWLRGTPSGEADPSNRAFIGISSTNEPYVDLPYNYVLKGMKFDSFAGAEHTVNAAVSVANLGSITVNELRMSFALQRLLERDARGGTRYREIIKAHFGVTSPDARMQIPEYLGGKRIPINVSQVLQTSATTEASPLGETGAFSLTSDSDSMFTYSSTEHGYIIGVCCVRTNHTYQQGIEKMWSRRRRFDFYWPALANIGEQAIMNREIYFSGTSADSKPFGYQEAWAEYRYKPSRVSGYMRSTIDVDGTPASTGSLDVWHYADNYDSTPTLSSGWIAETPDNIDRTLAVSSDVSHQFIVDFAFRCRCARPMPVYSVPGLIDHN